MISTSKKEFIEFMMSADVLRFGEFKTKSGRLSPYFVNTGNYKTGAQISTLGKFYAQCIMEHCGENFDAMFGPAYKGIPLDYGCSFLVNNEIFILVHEVAIHRLACDRLATHAF